MPRISPAGRRAALRAAIGLFGATLAAVAFGVLHGGAATPATQSVTVPSKAGKTVSTSSFTSSFPVGLDGVQLIANVKVASNLS